MGFNEKTFTTKISVFINSLFLLKHRLSIHVNPKQLSANQLFYYEVLNAEKLGG